MASYVTSVLLTTAVFQLSLVAGQDLGAVDDVTTVYRLGQSDEESNVPVEIHARTNAQGMPPLTEFGYLEPENTQDDILCWHSNYSYHEQKCNWTPKGFNLQFYQDYNGSRVFKQFFKEEVMVQMCRDNRNNDYVCNNYCRHRSDRQDSERRCEVHILPDDGPREGKPFCKLETVSRCGVCGISGYLKLCSPPPAQLPPPVPTAISPYDNYTCTTIKNFYLGNDNPPILWIEIKENQVKIWRSKEKNSLLGRSSIDHYLYLSDSNRLIEAFHSTDLEPPTLFTSQVLKSEPKKGSSLTSPRVVWDSEVCLRVVFHVSLNYTFNPQDVLSLSAADTFHEHYNLDTFNTNKGGWYSWKIEETLPEQMQGVPISLVLTTLTNSNVTIQRIASCNAKDKVDVSVITEDMIASTKKGNVESPFYNRKYYQVSYYEPQVISSTSSIGTECVNGGKMTDKGCACRAGFAGPDCSTACGMNSFGQDCEGKCSLYNETCQGLLLCTPGAGCHCAPGYVGVNCDQECMPGTYGAGCSEMCGKCKDEPCDAYTGHCLGCQPGYRLPYCKLKNAHFKTAPLVISPDYQTLIVTVDFSQENVIGLGQPIFYQVQYRRIEDDEWRVYSTQYVPKHKGLTAVRMEALEDAAEYMVRVILLVDDFNSYEDEDVPLAVVHTKCYIPDRYDYRFNVSTRQESHTHLQSVVFSWDYTPQEHWCPVVSYDFWWKDRWQWKKRTEIGNELKFSNMVTSAKLEAKVRASTIGGFAPFSKVVETSGVYDIRGSQEVRNLKVDLVERNSVEISWQPPAGLDWANISYTIHYACVERPSCSSPCKSSGSLNTTKTSASLTPLLSSAHYNVSVAADLGTKSFLYFRTLESVPEETPKMSEKRLIKTNSSATVFWEPTEVCSGFLNAYQYQLYMASDTTNVLDSGRTRNTSATFNTLKPSTEYVVRVSVVTTAGWDPTRYLEISVNTAATVPEKVMDLTVYKKTRNMVGLRWSEPKAMYGALESFTVSYSHQGAPVKSVSVSPTRCVPWPHLYCYTVEGLKPAKVYNFTVSARNTEVHEDGAETSVIAQTRESSPTAPQNLTVVNVTSTSLGLQWEHPDLANGVLRSFLISVEETEQFEQDSCCQDYPIIEIPFTEEQRHYQLEVGGLHPASSYSVSVSGKTVGFGASQTMTAATRPPALAVTPPPVEVEAGQWKWLPQTRLPQANTSQVYSPLARSQILLVLTNGTKSPVESGIQDQRLQTLLKQEIPSSFYFAAEYNQGDTVTLGSGEDGESVWGHFSNPPLDKEQVYQLAAVQISEYNKVLNIDVALSSEIIL